MLDLLESLLPHRETSPEERATQLGRAREIYRYSYQWPPEVAVAAEVPPQDSYSALYVAALLPSAWEIFKNTIGLVDLVHEKDGLARFFAEEGHRVPKLASSAIGDWYLRVANDLARYVASTTPPTVAAYHDLYPGIGLPSVSDKWQSDETFAWQRIAGVNPTTLTRITRMRDDVRIGEAEYARVLPGRGSLAGALAEGRVFACDYTFLDGAKTGESFGMKKWLPAPYAVFVADGGKLRPLAVQLGKQAGHRIVTPVDASLWTIAKLAVQIGDANHHETVAHLGRTHLVMEAVALALKRQLAERHPLHRLLWQHCEYTLPINHSAATNLIAAGGAIDLTFAGTIETSASFVKIGLDSFDLGRSSLPIDLATRGLDDRSVLPELPYRDDGLPVLGAIRRFVDRYVRHAYPADADVAADSELAAFCAELGASDGGRIRGVVAPATIDALVELVTTIVWIGTAQHAAVNFPQFPFMGYVPNMAGAFWGEWPPKDLDDPNLYATLLPPYNVAVLQLHTLYQLSSLRINHLGHYGVTTFFHPAVLEAIAQFKSELAEIERATRERDASRYMSYPHLLPSNIPLSIHI